jgi:hypothetical protein
LKTNARCDYCPTTLAGVFCLWHLFGKFLLSVYWLHEEVELLQLVSLLRPQVLQDLGSIGELAFQVILTYTSIPIHLGGTGLQWPLYTQSKVKLFVHAS